MYREILAKELKVDKTLGYVYFIDTKHLLSSNGVGRVYYHRHLASIMLNRWLTLEEVVHHIDHNKLNNEISNLKVMSVTEHSALHILDRGYLPKVELVCPVCSTKFMVSAGSADRRVHCSDSCANKAQTRWSISKEELQILIWNMSYTDIAKNFPISDVGAKKRAKSLGCIMPPPYFFNKTEEYRKEHRKQNNISDLHTQQSSKLLA